MKVLFLSISTAISDINNKGIYPDLLRKFASEGHEVYIVCPFERRSNKKTAYTKNNNVHILGVQTFNLTKSNKIEKGIGTILIEHQFKRAIKQYLNEIRFDLVLYSTPPITFYNVIKYLKEKCGAKTYLLLKDIFPQNAVDLGLISPKGFLHKYFRKKEKELYEISDFIGCMSQANVDYLIKNNSFITKNKIEICPNSIEITTKKTQDKTSITIKYNIPNNIPICIYGGNFGIGQGIPFLINVLESNINKGIYFLLIGNGTYYKKIKNWISTNQPTNVKLIKTLPKHEFETLESICDIGLVFLDKRFTIPNFPSRILSYMNSQIPLLIASDTVSDLGSISRKNGFGFWCESGDLSKFNEYLNVLAENAELRKEMGNSSYNFLQNNYDVKYSYETIIQHF